MARRLCAVTRLQDKAAISGKQPLADFRHLTFQALRRSLAGFLWDFWHEAKKLDRYVETPFAFTEGPGAILTGVIDLLFGHDGRWRIIDYKTDVGLTDLGAAYQAQLKMYEHALASVGLQDVTSAIQPVRGADD